MNEMIQEGCEFITEIDGNLYQCRIDDVYSDVRDFFPNLTPCHLVYLTIEQYQKEKGNFFS